MGRGGGGGGRFWGVWGGVWGGTSGKGLGFKEAERFSVHKQGRKSAPTGAILHFPVGLAPKQFCFG